MRTPSATTSAGGWATRVFRQRWSIWRYCRTPQGSWIGFRDQSMMSSFPCYGTRTPPSPWSAIILCATMSNPPPDPLRPAHSGLPGGRPPRDRSSSVTYGLYRSRPATLSPPKRLMATWRTSVGDIQGVCPYAWTARCITWSWWSVCPTSIIRTRPVETTPSGAVTGRAAVGWSPDLAYPIIVDAPATTTIIHKTTSKNFTNSNSPLSGLMFLRSTEARSPKSKIQQEGGMTQV